MRALIFSIIIFSFLGFIGKPTVEAREFDGLTANGALPFAIDRDFEEFWQGSIEREIAAMRLIGHTSAKFVSVFSEQRFGDNPVDTADLPDRCGRATRAVHRKAQGCYLGQLKFNSSPESVPASHRELFQGIFAAGSEYRAVVRFSNGNVRNHHDMIPDSRGIAVKLVSPEILSDSYKEVPSLVDIESATVANLNAVNFPVAFMMDPFQYNRMLEGFVNSAAQVKSTIEKLDLLGILPHPEQVADRIGTLIGGMRSRDIRTTMLGLAVNGLIPKNLLFQKYWSETAYRIGQESDREKVAFKFFFSPCLDGDYKDAIDSEWPEWSRVPHVNLGMKSGRIGASQVPEDFLASIKDQPNYLRTAIQTTLQDEREFCFELKAQVFQDLRNTPIEDATRVWLESEEQRSFLRGLDLRFVGDFLRELKSAESAFDLLGIEADYRLTAVERIFDVILRPAIAWMVDRLEGLKMFPNIDSLPIAPAFTVARLSFDRVDAEDMAKLGSGEWQEICEDLSFNPWQNPESLRPLGVVNRMRFWAYGRSVKERRELNGQTDCE